MYVAMLCAAGDHLCPRSGAAALERQPLGAGDTASRGYLVRRPTHGHCAIVGGHRVAGHHFYGRRAVGDRPYGCRVVGGCSCRRPWPQSTAPL
ncbi:hypothetical protein GW17_00054724 [Ensete ventricosum]|nr:hypothetical protein GW17_00054724 [Ensete ventricosum]RZR82269.1 hypothetical protein BHM03_00008640 [Ensete ventricosum]